MINTVLHSAKIPIWTLSVTSLFSPMLPAAAESAHSPPRALDLSGVYVSISGGEVLPGGYKNVGSPTSVQLLPLAFTRQNNSDKQEDPFKLCEAVGPFRMMALERTKIELVPAPGMVVMLFEDIAHGNLRTFYLDRPHLSNLKPTVQGDSVARWDGNALVVDTIGLDERSWLNESGAHASEALRLIERISPLRGGQILRYELRAEDAKALAKPLSYTRYYKKLSSEVQEDVCEIDSHWDCNDLCLK